MATRFATLAALSLLLVLAVLPGCGSAPRVAPRLSWDGEEASVELVYRGKARSVRVAGDFNDWNPERHPFIVGEDDLWTCTLRLPPGRHAYLLAVETEVGFAWRLDDANPARTRDGLGRELSLLVIDAGNAADAAAADRQGR